MRPPVTAATILSLWLAAAVPAQEGTTVPAFPLDEIERGAKGYGLSVFAGTEPQRFDVELIGLINNLHPDTSFVLARLSGHDLERSGVVGGMSGSPVYIDDKLVGAVAFSWSFTHEAIAGITPIGAMRDLGSRPRQPAAAAPQAVSLAELASGDIPEERLHRRLAALAPRSLDGAGSQLQFTTVGFGGATRGFLAQALGPVAPAGSRPDLDTELLPGSAVAAVLIGGDLEFAASGTITERRGDQVVAFGHPYLGMGAIDIPMATSEVVTVISSQASSFKVSNVGPVVGAFREDRMAGISGRIGATAPTIPMEIRISGDPGSRYRLELAELSVSTPTLSALALLEAVNATHGQSGNQDLEMRAGVQLRGHAPVELGQHFSGTSATMGSAIYLLSVLNFLLNNGDEDVVIDGIEVDLIQEPQPRTVSLVAAHASRRNVRPGEEITVHLDLRRYRGETFRRDVRVTVPDDVRRGPYFLFVGESAAIDSAKLQMQPREPRTFSESLELLRSFHHPDELVILGVVPARGLVVEGRALPDLPASVRSIWAAAGPLAAKASALAIRDESSRELDFPLSGAARLDLNVLPAID
ncbi:MAG: SpoIVB peptidase S55 domain-containing protein [Thermoanaerobaculia bacterium]|nr:SpoIVB peptidase S55 domain-containing protein [Thermoanaerobaculia bacterium]